jgi:hypothetical protein
VCRKWTEGGGGREEGTEFKMKRKRKAKMIGINIWMFMNKNLGILKMKGGFV